MPKSVKNGLAMVSHRSNKILTVAAIGAGVLGSNAMAITATDVDLSSAVADIGIALVSLIALGVAIKGAKKVIGMFG